MRDHHPQRLTVGLMAAFLMALASAQAADGDLDWARVRQLHARVQQGQKLSAEDQAYYDRGREARRKGGATRPERRKGKPGGASEGKDSTGLVPLTELGTDKYKGENGGLYGDGSNEPPLAHLAAAKSETARTQPLDGEGKPATDGKVVLLSIGMSNTTQEFSKFKELADGDADKSARLVIVDGAQGGKDARNWADAEGPGSARGQQVWATADERLKSAGVTPQQVQVIWIKQALARVGQYGEFPEHAHKLESDLVTILQLAKKRYPNLRVAYLSSRTYAGYAATELNPEPYSYESAFSVRWLIDRQIKGDAALNYSADKGAVKSPLVLWGPYLWADGVKPRKADGLTYTRDDLSAKDGTHPSDAGRQKIAEQIWKFFKGDLLAKTWFIKAS